MLKPQPVTPRPLALLKAFSCSVLLAAVSHCRSVCVTRQRVGNASAARRRSSKALGSSVNTYDMSSTQSSGPLQQVVGFLSAALARVQSIAAGGSGGTKSRDAAAAITSACDILKPQLVRFGIVLKAGPAPPSIMDSFCSESLPALSALASSFATVLAGADHVRLRVSRFLVLKSSL